MYFTYMLSSKVYIFKNIESGKFCLLALAFLVLHIYSISKVKPGVATEKYSYINFGSRNFTLHKKMEQKLKTHSNDTLSDDDEILYEIPLFLNQKGSSCHILEYVTLPAEYDKPSLPNKSMMKPECGLIRLHFPIEQNNNIDCDQSAGIAANVDARSSEKTYEGGVMDHVAYQGILHKETRDCVGFLDQDGLHVTPVASSALMELDFSFLDKMDSNAREPKEEAVRDVSAKFQRVETEKSRMFRERTSKFHRQKIQDEKWTNLHYRAVKKSAMGDELESYLCCQELEQSGPCVVEKTEYRAKVSSVPVGQARVLFNGQTYTSYKEAVEALMRNGHVLGLNDILVYLGCGISPEDAINLVSEVASLVQGQWVIKSSLVFVPSADAGLLEKARLADEEKKDFRDTVLCWLALYGEFSMESLKALINIPMADVINMLGEVAQITKDKVLLKKPTDQSFIDKYPKLNRDHLARWKTIHKKLLEKQKAKEKTKMK